jgi:hypothetical protein
LVGAQLQQQHNDYIPPPPQQTITTTTPTRYQPDLIYFDSRLGDIDEQHRLAFLAGYYNAAEQWIKNGTSTGVVTTYKVPLGDA